VKIVGWIFVFLIVAAGAVGIFIGKRKYDAFMADVGACHLDRDRLTADVARLSGERADKEKQAAEATGTLNATRAELEDLRQQRAEADKRLEAFNAVRSKLQKMIDTGKLKVVIVRGRMVVKLPAEVLFPSGKAELSPAGESALTEVAAVLKEFKDRKFMVAGHTDIVPTDGAPYKNNWELSTARALTVTQFLTSKGVRPPNLAVAGYGEWDPVASNQTPQGRQENRRIELVLLPHSDEVLPVADQPAAPAASASNVPASAKP
jgi:chemotaxis protein MotB